MAIDQRTDLVRHEGRIRFSGCRSWYLAALVAVAMVSLAAYQPVLDAYYFLDDFAFIALSRYTEQPLLYYGVSHFPGNLFYRPTGLLLWWLTVALDLSVRGQFVVNWLLLLAAGLLLIHLLRCFGIRSAIALAAGLLFVLHPISVMTTSWLSNRFDLLAVVGVLIAVIGAEKHRGGGARSILLLVGAGTLLAVTSKELGFMVPLLLWMQARGGFWRRSLALPVLVAVAIAVPVFVTRQMLIGGGDQVLYPDGMIAALIDGVLVWLQRLPDFLFLNGPLFWLSAIVVIAAVLFARFRRGVTAGTVPMAMGVVIAVLAMIMQSPTVSQSAVALPEATTFNGNAYFAARFYYLALIGLLIAAAGAAECLLTAVAAASLKSARVAGAVGLLLGAGLCVFWGWHAHAQGRLWAAESSSTRAVIEAAASAAARSGYGGDGGDGCRLYFTGTTGLTAAFWPYADVAVKAVAPLRDALRLGSCFISTENTPWFHILRGPDAVEPGGALQPICHFGRVLPAQRISGVTFHYLAFPHAETTLSPSPADRVFRYDARAERFDEITEQVMAGTVIVVPRWSRPLENACPP